MVSSKYHTAHLPFYRDHCLGHLYRDTVSSVGLARSDKNLPLTTSGMKHVCYFRHALAIDERRVKFLPEFAWGSAGPNYEDCKGEMPHTKEVWFAGTHSDM
jgi:uncharacterized protein (DUF2235 family)